MAEEIVLTDRNLSKHSLQDELSKLYSQGFLTDITLSTEDGKNFEAHRVLLAARSHYFYTIIPRLKSEAVIFLKGIKGAHLDKILKYIYSGSVALSRHQLKPILEAAKSLQVKGLSEADPSDILSRQVLPGTSSTAAAMAHRFKQPETPPAVSQMSLRSPSGSGGSSVQSQPRHTSSTHVLSNSVTTVDKMTLTSFNSKKSDSISSTSISGFSNGVEGVSGSDSDSENEMIVKVEDFSSQTTDPQTKRKRGRPPKNQKNKKATKSWEISQSQEADTNTELGAENHFSKNQNETKEDDVGTTGANVVEDDQPHVKKRVSKHIATINGKRVVSVTCKNVRAEFHIARFANGMRGRCIQHEDKWLTPREFELACGSNGKKYLESITTEFGPLKTFTASGVLKPHSRKCRCSICRDEAGIEKVLTIDRLGGSDEDHELVGDNSGDRHPTKDENEAEAVGNEGQNDDFASSVEESEVSRGQGDLEDDMLNQHDHSSKLDLPRAMKRKKKKHNRDDWRKQLVDDQLRHQQQQQQQQQQHHHHIQIGTFTIEQQDHTQHLQMSMSQEQITTLTGAGPLSTLVMSSTQDQQSKMSPVILSDRIEPPQHIQTPTFYVMSPHPHMQAPPTPHHNPFASITPVPSPAPPMTPQLTHISPSPMSMMSPTMNSKSSLSSMNPPSKLAAVLNVRCKSTTALLYTNKYETGSKGKCIQLGDEWLTPNEFEDRAGSKAKKYLSSIKCMGRPLRVYVNSGELRGTGPMPPVKPKKQNFSMAMKTPTSIPINIAPAPGPGNYSNAMQASQHHMSSANSLPQHLNMMMSPGPHNSGPIFINQATSMLTNQQILAAPMTFTLAQPLDVRQAVSQQM